MAILSSTTIQGSLFGNDDLYIKGSNGICFNDLNTKIWKNVDLTFKDAVAGEYTLQQLLTGNPSVQGSRIIESYTESDSPVNLQARQTGNILTNLGAINSVSFYLPLAVVDGIEFIFAVQAAQSLFIYPGSGRSIKDDSGQTIDSYKTANVIGETITLIADRDGNWGTIAKEGTWTEGP
ncbi:MAG: hypothetical protein ACTSSP_01125 [Candidatus Asgardarchaeia archaeon]